MKTSFTCSDKIPKFGVIKYQQKKNVIDILDNNDIAYIYPSIRGGSRISS
jgi:hypothetical protein